MIQSFLGDGEFLLGPNLKNCDIAVDFQENAQLFSRERKLDGGLQGLPKTRLNLSAGGGSTRYSQTSMVRTSGTNKQINKQKRH